MTLRTDRRQPRSSRSRSTRWSRRRRSGPRTTARSASRSSTAPPPRASPTSRSPPPRPASRRRHSAPTRTAARSSSRSRSAPTRSRSNTPGFLDRDGKQHVDDDHDVVAKTIVFATMLYDVADSAPASTSTRTGPGAVSAPAATSQASKARNVSLTNGAKRRPARICPNARRRRPVAATAVPVRRERPTRSSPAPARYEHPTVRRYVRNPNYFARIEPGGRPARRPAQSSRSRATVRQPPFNIRIGRAAAPRRQTDGDGAWSTPSSTSRPARPTPAPSQVALTTTGRPATWGDRAASAPQTNAEALGLADETRPSTRACRSASTRSACVTRCQPNAYATIGTNYDNTTPNGGQAAARTPSTIDGTSRTGARRRARDARLREEDGMTLPEVLVTMVDRPRRFARDVRPRRRHHAPDRRDHARVATRPARPRRDGHDDAPVALAGLLGPTPPPRGRSMPAPRPRSRSTSTCATRAPRRPRRARADACAGREKRSLTLETAGT